MRRKNFLKKISILMLVSILAFVPLTEGVLYAPNADLTPEQLEALRREEEEEARRVMEEENRREAERQAEKARQEAEKAAAEAARQEAERQAEAARKEAERIAAEKAAAEKARIEAENKAKAEAEAKAKAEAERIAAENKAKADAAEKARLEAEAKAKAEAERIAAEKAKQEATPTESTKKTYTVEEMKAMAKAALEKARQEAASQNSESNTKVEEPVKVETVNPIPPAPAVVVKPQPVVTPTPATNTTVNRDSSIDEATAQSVVDSFRKEHPSGQSWTNNDLYTTSYKNENGVYTFLNAYGCAGFVYNLSDNLYGQGTPAVTMYADKTNNIVSQVQKYDIVHLNGGSHYVIVLDIDSKGNATVAEANVNGQVRWDKVYNLNTSNVTSVTRRIPEENFQAKEVKSSYDPNANIAKTTDAKVDQDAVNSILAKLRAQGLIK